MKEAYEKLKKEYPVLPAYDSINNEFEISLIEADQFLIRQIKKKLGEKLEIILGFLEHIINPDASSFADMYECGCFTDGEKKQVLDVFRHLMRSYRSLLETDVIGDDELNAQTIRKISDNWKEHKKQIIPFLKKTSECWEKHVEPKEVLDYLG